MNKTNPQDGAKKPFQEEEMRANGAPNLQEEQNVSAENEMNADNVSEEPCADPEKKYNDLNDSHLRLMAEFDNYRKRTLREKAELIKTGGEAVLINLLPVIDDFERALTTIKKAEDIQAVAEGVELIYTKFMSFLAQQGVKPIEPLNQVFDTETSDAVATIPAPEETLKGKVIDCVQTGYTLHDKVIRHAKVVVGE
ncbi:nucleotide exchange factor GrpE [Parabacteroides sp. PF5-6]|uniref:nucleotide exchange factor GrpE n=1 Tax=Parabacteroides sp. PF5-6 TaxID=1742403 RepID=UPI0024071939|nr:nucleotide exchange factor GrpE [Parabacteroides sp. PF5-6]MDF9828804.1 molecular chaperone GrpE [Parabacteroides sp. PF5-6]